MSDSIYDRLGGEEAIDAAVEIFYKKVLADERINVTAVDGVAAGRQRYGMILWVKPKDYARASRVLRAK